MISRQCSNCLNMSQLTNESGVPTCLAFPEGIPERILRGNIDHSLPVDGDHGFRYDPMVPDLDDSDGG